METIQAHRYHFPYKTEKNRAFPGQPHGKTEIFRKNYKFSTQGGQKGEKIPFWPLFCRPRADRGRRTCPSGNMTETRRPLAAQIDLSKNE